MRHALQHHLPHGALLAALALGGCSGGEPDETGPTQIPEDTSPSFDTAAFDTSPLLPSLDTGTGGLGNETPPNTLLVIQQGFWDLTPAGGPVYAGIVGALNVLELVNGRAVDTSDTGDLPECEVTFSIAGERQYEHNCGTCNFVFDVTFTVTEGDPNACNDRDLPRDGTEWRLGFSAADGAILNDFAFSGTWIPWYAAETDGDRINYSYQRQLGFYVEEEED